MINTINENNNGAYSPYQITTKPDGTIELDLLETYHNAGVDSDLPEVLVLPDVIDGKEVTSLKQDMFANNKRIKEITLPVNVTAIPNGFCRSATNLRAIHGTKQITNIGEKAFLYTRLKEALFPSLDTMLLGAFANCAYLETVNIGKVKTIPELAFYRCACLRDVSWEGSQVSI